jgi:hypothetical protein
MICEIKGCDGSVRARGLCSKHYYRSWMYGDPFAGRTARGSLLRFIEDVVLDPPEGCVIWPFGLAGLGYGYLRVSGRRTTAHRYALIAFSGDPPEPSMVAAHNCHTPACVNPKHLRWATSAENQADRRKDGTHLQGEDAPWSKLTAEDVLRIRSDNRPQQAIANDYAITQTNVSRIKLRKSWRWLA